jgi:hypothetical protein
MSGGASSAYTYLQGLGYINGTGSTLLVSGSSPLTWFGGNMPIGGPASNAQAVSDMNAWVAAGALDN